MKQVSIISEKHLLRSSPLNFLPLALSAALLVLLLLLLALTLPWDREALLSAATQPLLDNAAAHDGAYELVVETGVMTGSGTSSRVFFVLHGEKGASETRELTAVTDASAPLLRTATRNRFLVT